MINIKEIYQLLIFPEYQTKILYNFHKIYLKPIGNQKGISLIVSKIIGLIKLYNICFNSHNNLQFFIYFQT